MDRPGAPSLSEAPSYPRLGSRPVSGGRERGRVITGKKLHGLSHYSPELRGCPGGSRCCIAEPSGRTDLRPGGNPPKLGVRRQRSQELTARQVSPRWVQGVRPSGPDKSRRRSQPLRHKQGRGNRVGADQRLPLGDGCDPVRAELREFDPRVGARSAISVGVGACQPPAGKTALRNGPPPAAL